MPYRDPIDDKEMEASCNMLRFDLRMAHPTWANERIEREVERCRAAKRGERRSMWMSAVSRAQIAERHRVRRKEAATRSRERAKAVKEGRYKDACS